MTYSFWPRLAAAAALICSSYAAGAADLPRASAPPPPRAAYAAPDSEVTIGIYGWLASLSGDLTPRRDFPQIETKESSPLKHLRGAFMGFAEYRMDRYLIAGDFAWASFGEKGNPPGPLFNTASWKVSGWTANVVGGYRLVQDPAGTLDLVAGARGYSMTVKGATTSDLALLNATAEADKAWVDPIIGFKGRYNLGSNFFLSGWANIGGFGVGSKLSWDVMGGVGYAFTKTTSMLVSYRALGVDFSRNGFDYNVIQQGPLAAVVFKF